MNRNINESYYEDDEIMAQLGRNLVDQYIGWCNKYGRPRDLTGWPSYAQLMIEEFLAVSEEEDDDEQN